MDGAALVRVGRRREGGVGTVGTAKVVGPAGGGARVERDRGVIGQVIELDMGSAGTKDDFAGIGGDVGGDLGPDTGHRAVDRARRVVEIAVARLARVVVRVPDDAAGSVGGGRLGAHVGQRLLIRHAREHDTHRVIAVEPFDGTVARHVVAVDIVGRVIVGAPDGVEVEVVRAGARHLIGRGCEDERVGRKVVGVGLRAIAEARDRGDPGGPVDLGVGGGFLCDGGGGRLRVEALGLGAVGPDRPADQRVAVAPHVAPVRQVVLGVGGPAELLLTGRVDAGRVGPGAVACVELDLVSVGQEVEGHGVVAVCGLEGGLGGADEPLGGGGRTGPDLGTVLLDLSRGVVQIGVAGGGVVVVRVPDNAAGGIGVSRVGARVGDRGLPHHAVVRDIGGVEVVGLAVTVDADALDGVGDVVRIPDGPEGLAARGKRVAEQGAAGLLSGDLGPEVRVGLGHGARVEHGAVVAVLGVADTLGGADGAPGRTAGQALELADGDLGRTVLGGQAVDAVPDVDVLLARPAHEGVAVARGRVGQGDLVVRALIGHVGGLGRRVGGRADLEGHRVGVGLPDGIEGEATVGRDGCGQGRDQVLCALGRILVALGVGAAHKAPGPAGDGDSGGALGLVDGAVGRIVVPVLVPGPALERIALATDRARRTVGGQRDRLVRVVGARRVQAFAVGVGRPDGALLLALHEGQIVCVGLIDQDQVRVAVGRDLRGGDGAEPRLGLHRAADPGIASVALAGDEGVAGNGKGGICLDQGLGGLVPSVEVVGVVGRVGDAVASRELRISGGARGAGAREDEVARVLAHLARGPRAGFVELARGGVAQDVPVLVDGVEVTVAVDDPAFDVVGRRVAGLPDGVQLDRFLGGHGIVRILAREDGALVGRARRVLRETARRGAGVLGLVGRGGGTRGPAEEGVALAGQVGGQARRLVGAVGRDRAVGRGLVVPGGGGVGAAADLEGHGRGLCLVEEDEHGGAVAQDLLAGLGLPGGEVEGLLARRERHVGLVPDVLIAYGLADIVAVVGHIGLRLVGPGVLAGDAVRVRDAVVPGGLVALGGASLVAIVHRAVGIAVELAVRVQCHAAPVARHGPALDGVGRVRVGIPDGPDGLVRGGHHEGPGLHGGVDDRAVVLRIGRAVLDALPGVVGGRTRHVGDHGRARRRPVLLRGPALERVAAARGIRGQGVGLVRVEGDVLVDALDAGVRAALEVEGVRQGLPDGVERERRSGGHAVVGALGGEIGALCRVTRGDGGVGVDDRTGGLVVVAAGTRGRGGLVGPGPAAQHIARAGDGLARHRRQVEVLVGIVGA